MNFLQHHPLIVAGDFNSHVCWDSESGEEADDHKRIVDRLKDFGLSSAYHAYNKCNQGKEKHHTLFFTYNKRKLFHIDYTFASDALVGQSKCKVSVGLGKDPYYWLGFSDHVPMMFSFDLD